MNVEHVDKPTAQLVRLVQQELKGDSVLSDEAGFARLEARMTRQPSSWSKRWLVSGAAVAALTSALAAAWFFQPRAHALTFEVASGALDGSGRILATDSTRIRFSDGSEASLARGTEARIENVSEHGADVVLARGSMRVHIAKRPQASWKVVAGPYDVRVTGTAFDVSWSDQTFDLRMQTGAVIVSGPLALGGIALRAGQHLFVTEGKLTVEGGEAPSVGSSLPVAAAEAPAEAGAVPEPLPDAPGAALSPVPAGLAPPASGEAHAWTRQVAEGHFNAVLEQAEKRGLERTLAGGSLEELAALADAARYAGRAPVAKRVLLAERQRFPGSGAARDAAFFLGRIAEDSGGGSEWYERYVSESPRGAYASQAFGRKMMLLYKQRGAAVARPAAADYLSRYPNGPYAAAARKLTEESPTPRGP